MNSNDGDLYFRAGIDLDGFNAGANAMERRMKDVSASVVTSAGNMDDAISSIGSAFTKIVGAGAAAGFVKQMFNVRSEMQNTEAMLRVFLGSAEKADAFFKSLQGYAYNNVFEFKDLAQQSAQLLAYRTNVEDVIPTLNKLSEIAAGTNVPLEELVSLFNKVKSTDKLDSNAIYSLGSKGIPVREVIAEIREMETGVKQVAKEVDVTGLKFADLQKIIDHVATGEGMFSGMMQEKMKTLGDSWGLMQDNITNMFNEIGEANQGLLKSGMDVANYLIEHYQEVAKILGTLVVAFGAAKAANIAMSLAQKNGTGVAVIDNTVWAIRAKLMQAEMMNGKGVTASIRDIKKAQEEEIATLKAQITEEQNAEIIRQSRLKSLDQILTSTQKQKLAQMGLTEANEQYLPIASSMLTKEQQMAMAQSDLTQNNQAYINALKDMIATNKEEIAAIDERYEAAKKNLAQAEAELDTRKHLRDALQERLEALEEEKDALYDNGNAADYAEACAEAETVADKLNTAEENLNTAAKKYNEAQTEMLTVAEQKNTIATTTNTTADKANTAQKNLLSVAVGKLKLRIQALWAVMKANPIGAVLTVATALYGIISNFVSKSKEAKEAQDAENRAMAEFSTETAKVKAKVDTLAASLRTAKQGSREYNDALKEVNTMCKEYNLTSLGVNATLGEQKQKYEELKTAIDNATAARIRDKYAEEAFSNKQEREADIDNDFTDAANKHHSYLAGTNLFGDDKFHKETLYWNEALHGLAEDNQLGLVQTRMKSLAADVAIGSATAEDALENVFALMKELGHYADSDSRRVIEEYFGQYVDSAKQTSQEVEQINASMDAFTKTLNTSAGNEEKIVTVAEKRKTLTQEIVSLEKEIADLQKGTAAYDKDELEKKQKQLKEKQSELQNLNGGKSAQDIANKRKALIQKDKELELERQEAVIEAMQDGAEKREAQLRLQYEREMLAIQNEQDDLKKQRKEAGKKASLTDDEQAAFAEKEKKAAHTLSEGLKTIYDSEVAYRKGKYEEYYSWVEQLGEDVANKQFADLLKGGATYEDYLTNEIGRMQQLQQQGKATEADLRYLMNLLNEMDTYSGEKSSLEKFIENTEHALSNAPSLIEKMKLLEEAIKNLANVEGDEFSKNGYALKLAQMVADTQQEIDDNFKSSYKSYTDKRLEIEKQYRADIAKLTQQGRAEEARQLEEQMQETIKSLDTEFLQGVISKALKTPSKNNIKEALQTLNDIENMTTGEFNAKYNQSLNDEQLKRMKEQLRELKQELKGMNLGTAIKQAFTGETAEEVQEGVDYIVNGFSKVSNVARGIADAMHEFAKATSNAKLEKMADTFDAIANTISTAGSYAAAGAQIGGGWGAVIGAVLGIGQGVLTGVLNSNAEKQQRIAQAAEEGLEYQKSIADQLLTIIDSVDGLGDTISSLNFTEYRSAMLELINQLKEGGDLYVGRNGKTFWNTIKDAVQGSSYNTIGKNNMWQRLVEQGLISADEANARDRANFNSAKHEDWNSSVNSFLFGWIDSLTLSETPHTYHIDKDEYKKNSAEDIANYLNWYFGQYNVEREKLAEELEDYYKNNPFDVLGLFNENNKAYDLQKRELEDYIKLYEALGDDEMVAELKKRLAELELTMSTSLQHMAESLYGMDVSSIIEEWISIFDEFKDNVEGAFNAIDQSVDKMIANMIKQLVVVKPLMDKLTSIFDDYIKEKGEGYQFGQEDFILIANRIKEAKGDALENYQDYLDFLDALGINLDDLTDTSTLTGSIQNLSEETGGVIAGRLNAMVINQADGNDFLRQSLLVQIEMKNNVIQIANDVSVIKRNTTYNQQPFNAQMNYGYTERMRY